MKEITMANLDQYRAVLEDLMKQRREYDFKIHEIENAVAALRRLMPAEDIPTQPDSRQLLPLIHNGKYVGMSTRWAVLWLLTEDATGPLTTGQIADALQAGGMVSNARSFASNVSAVLSGMNHEKGEVVSKGGTWTISEKGRDAWVHIKASRERKEVITISRVAPTSFAETIPYPESANAS